MSKSQKKSSKKRKRSRSSSDMGDSLNTLLLRGILKYPDFLQDFTQIIASMDQGKSVSVEGVENEELRALYKLIFAELPLECQYGQWLKRHQTKPLNRMILSLLLKYQSIEQPRELSSVKSSSIRIARQVLQLFSTVPQLQAEFRYLLQKLIDGEEVDVRGIDNAQIKMCLERFFEPLALETEYSDVYALAEEQKELKAALLLVIPHLELPQIILTNENDDSDSDGSSSNRASDNENSDSEVISGAIGPAMPSKEQLRAAAEQAKLQLSVADTSDDDDIGPSLPAPGEVIYAPRLPMRASQVMPTDTSGREEWMLTPGKSNSFEVQALSGSSVSRKFQHGKEARKSNEALQAQRDAEEAAYRNSAEGIRTQALLDEYREKRGPSLMDMHHVSGVTKSNTKLRGFNRDDDMALHRKLNKHEAEAMVEQSKTLDSRFNRSIEKSFL